MIELQWPWIFLLLPLPYLVWRFAPAKRASKQALLMPFYDDLQREERSQPRSSLWRMILLSAIWLCLLVACSRPIYIGEAVELPASGRDLLLAVDFSGSMKTPDMIIRDESITRLSAVKAVVGEFVQRRKQDRLGLVIFGNQAYLQAPLTFDRATVKQLLDEAQLGIAGEKTAIGDAIGLSVKRLRERPAESRVMILLTDGANTAGEITPLKAAQLAEQTKVKIYTIGIGADSMRVGGILGSSFGARTMNPSADLDEDTLKKIAEQTGGQYFRARNPQELENIYQLLDELEPIEQSEETFRPQQSWLHWPLGLALLLSLFGLLIHNGHIWLAQIDSPAPSTQNSGAKHE